MIDRLGRLDTVHQRDGHTDSHVAIANATPKHCVGRLKYTVAVPDKFGHIGTPTIQSY